MRSDTNQILLIIAGIVVAALFGVFFYREVFPEYRIYQDDYIALEQFRETYTSQPIPPFKTGIKQIVIESNHNGPAAVDRCVSCHVALQIPYFSPARIATDLNGNVVYDPDGRPVQVPNEEYIWQKLDEKIAELRDPKVLENLNSQGEAREVKRRLQQAAEYEGLKTAEVRGQVYDVAKVLSAHPLIGNETRPFEYHSLEEYGCTSCHSGNGRGLVTDRAHGPVFDGQYEEEYEGPVPAFTEPDLKNDPRFAQMFNAKPGSRLIFQTTPILIGPLIQSKCMDCHHRSDIKLESAGASAFGLVEKREKKTQLLLKAYENDKQSLMDLLKIRQMVSHEGYATTIEDLKIQQVNYALPELELQHIDAQMKYLKEAAGSAGSDEQREQRVIKKLDEDLKRLLGSRSLAEQLQDIFSKKGSSGIDGFLKSHQGSPDAKGSLFDLGEALDYNQDLLQHAKDVKESFTASINDHQVMTALSSDVDELTRNYQRGKELYLSQACYACHRIAGLARGGVGPELTHIGESYPWYIKRSIVWPQADLPSSTMPNMRLDHLELQDLMTFLLAQKGGNRAVAQTAYQEDLQAWESGKKLPWEKPVPPAQIYDLNYAMTVFATEGCASCHRLQGFVSDVGFKVEKESPSFETLYEKQRWFKQLFPEVIHLSHYDEELPGSHIVEMIEKHAKEIDERIVPDARQNSLLEEIDRNHPQVIESMYSNFRYASRAKNDYYITLELAEKDPVKIAEIKEQQQVWQERVHRVLMIYIQTYGLGRLIGPHLNWSGIYRSDQWLMEHFRNPAGHIPRSIMPILPFDDTKFYALTNMLDHLAIRNRQSVREIWTHQGFDPQEAFNMHCAQCHGITFHGNGAIAQWIFPLPKNLRSADFLRNLTKEQVILSITHGVKGTPMPPWGEVAKDKPEEIQKAAPQIPILNDSEIHYLVDWLFSSLPGGEVIKERGVPKWQYGPKNILEELKREGSKLTPAPLQKNELSFYPFPSGKGLYASLNPKVYSTQTEEEVDQLFDVFPDHQHPGIDHYYIKKKYYTSYNIAHGKQFFLLNCAVCHGNEADGTGPRAEVMREAKPRVLTDLDWIKSKDDIYLLRSIKYGVPGTSMTPWGDLTNGLQRMQLVMFIRTLSEEQDRREKLIAVLYETFETALITIDRARIGYSKEIEELKRQNRALKQKQTALERSVEENLALQNYKQNLEIERQMDQFQNDDQQLLMLKEELKREKEIFYSLGLNLLSKGVSDELFWKYIELIQLNMQAYALQNLKLVFLLPQDHEAKARELVQAMIKEMERKIASLEQEKRVISGKMASAVRSEELMNIQADLEANKKLKAKMITDIEETFRSVEKQKEMISKINGGEER